MQNSKQSKVPFPNNFYEIPCKPQFVLIQVLMKWLLQNFAQNTSYTVVAWAKLCYNLVTMDGITAEQIFHRIWIMGDELLVKR